MMNKECSVAGMKALFAIFLTGGFVLRDFLESSCQGSWTQEKGWLLLLQAGRQKILGKQRKQAGEGEVKGSNQSETVFGWGKSLCFVHEFMDAFIHAFIHTFIYLQAFLRCLGGAEL